MCHEGTEGSMVYFYCFLLPSLQMGLGGQRQASATLSSLLRPGTYWVGPRACLDGFRKRFLHRSSSPEPSSR